MLPKVGKMPAKLILQGVLVFAVLGMTWTAVQGKVLGVFGDSLSDDGNGKPPMLPL